MGFLDNSLSDVTTEPLEGKSQASIVQEISGGTIVPHGVDKLNDLWPDP